MTSTVSGPVLLGAEIQHFAQSLSFLFRGSDETPWVEASMYSMCAATGALFELLMFLWRGGLRSSEALSSAHDQARGGEPVLRIWVPDEATVLAASELPIRSFFSRWEVYSESGVTFLLVSASRETIRPYLPTVPLALSLALHGLDEKVVL